jgi:hypothetical protein
VSRRRAIGIALGALGLAFAAQASAAVAPVSPVSLVRPKPPQPDVTAAAAGQLAAQGSGIVSLQGRLIAYGRILGPGLIVVRDPGGDAVVRVNGRLRRIPRSGVLRIALASVEGDGSPFFVHDASGVQVRIMGVVLDVAAAGHGRAVLDGDGNFSVNGSTTRQSWSQADDGPVAVEPETAQ